MKTNQTQKNIPDDWREGNLQNFGVSVIDGDRGKNYPSHNELTADGFCLFLTAANVSKNGFNFEENQFISKEKDLKMSKGKLARGDIVITTRGTIGNIAFYSEKIPYENIRINSGMAIIRNNNEILKTEFLFDYFNSSKFSKEIKRVSFGSAQPQLTVQIIKKFELLAPKQKDEQNRIVSVLETWDRAVEVLGRKIEIKKRIKKGLMQKLLTGAVRLPGFSGKWEMVKLGNVGEIVTGNTPPKIDIENYTGVHCWATAEDFESKYIYDTKIKLSDVGKSNSRFVPEGSVLVTCIASIGKNAVAKVPLATNQQINAIVVNKKYNNEFVYYLIQNSTNLLKRMAGAGAMQILNKSEFSKLKIIVPQKEEQTAIAEILTTADTEITALEKKLAFLKDQKKFLLNNLITGTIRTPQP